MNKIDVLLKYQQGITDIQYIINILKWELRISSSKGSQQDLVNLITRYQSKLFKLQTSECYGKFLKAAIEDDSFRKLEDVEQRYIYNQLRHYTDYEKVPSDFYAEYTEVKNKANLAWRQAKEVNDYEIFKPYLKTVIEMTKQYYRYLDNDSTNLYDVMLNQYETGMTSDVIDNLFNELKKEILPLISKQSVQKENFNFNYTDKELMECAEFLLDYIGFDMNKGTLGVYPHGFTEKMGPNDIRIAFRHTNNIFNFVSTIIHEGGHGIYEQNIAPNLSKYENITIDNLYALHESQSRFYENVLGKNINFWIPIYNEFSRKMHLNMSIEEFVSNLNMVAPSLIRTEADELTYCMHIIIRYEIERAIFSNQMTVEEIPEVWNSKMKEYLNQEVDTDSNGLMQDIHWSEGHFGYFPSYLLGSIFDGMFLEAIEKDLGSVDKILKTGRVKDITNYLIDKIYKNGGAYTAKELIHTMCGKDINVKPLVKYFRQKYKK